MHRYWFTIRTYMLLVFLTIFLTLDPVYIQAAPLLGVITPQELTDQTPDEPLTNPSTSSYSSRYLSGFGEDDIFTVFFEDRDSSNTISYVSTIQGPTKFPATITATNINDTHFLVKDWPYYYDGEWYGYRGWGSVENNPNHNFYVSNDLDTWILVNTFSIPNAVTFTTARGTVYYGFHDVIILNNMYYAWAESNNGETMIVRSSWGGDQWEAFAKVGGTQEKDGPLLMPVGFSPTPTGSFFELANDGGYGKLHVPGDDSGIYLAVNTVAKPSQDQGILEANFINPANWTWHDGSTGRLTSAHALLYRTASHDYREVWMVPQTNDEDPWVILYTADFNGTKALGFATGPTLCIPGLMCTLLPIVYK
jgi:hypothetical protein